MTEQRPQGQLDPWHYDPAEDVDDADLEAEYAAEEDAERKAEGYPEVPLASEVLGQPKPPTPS